MMARPLRIQYPGAFYHVMCRGNRRRKIFLDKDDRYRFIGIISESLSIYHVILYAYIMMDNHFHLVLQTPRGNLSEFMRRCNISYTSWFNFHHDTCGHLYQGRYKALLIDADNYLLEVSRYVHLNPVRAGRLRHCDYKEKLQYVYKYQWSSAAGYIYEKRKVDFVNYTMILEMIGGCRAYRKFLYEGIKDGVRDFFKDVQFQTILGGTEFVAEMKGIYRDTGSLREQPTYREMIKQTIEPMKVIVCCAEIMGVAVNQITERSGDGIIRGIVADMIYRYSGVTQDVIGTLLGGIGYTAVNMLRCRLQKKMKDPEVRKRYVLVEQHLDRFCDL